MCPEAAPGFGAPYSLADGALSRATFQAHSQMEYPVLKTLGSALFPFPGKISVRSG